MEPISININSLISIPQRRIFHQFSSFMWEWLSSFFFFCFLIFTRRMPRKVYFTARTPGVSLLWTFVQRNWIYSSPFMPRSRRGDKSFRWICFDEEKARRCRIRKGRLVPCQDVNAHRGSMRRRRWLSVSGVKKPEGRGKRREGLLRRYNLNANANPFTRRCNAWQKSIFAVSAAR